MSWDWADTQRELIKTNVLSNSGVAGESPDFQEFSISFLDDLLRGSSNLNHEVIEKIAHQLVASGQSLENAWYHFSNLIYSAAMSTSSDSSHQRLVELIFAFANFESQGSDGNEADDPEVVSTFKELKGFGWIARDLWNGPSNFIREYGTGEAAIQAWVNLNRFVAHLSVQQRLTPVEPLQDWLEDFGLWTISDGLEFRKGGREYGEAAAAWLVIAGSDIWLDPTWGKRDGNPGPGIPVRVGGIWSYRLENGATHDMRWDFWRERLLDIASDESLDESTRETMRQAERATEGIEASSQTSQ
ncbi:uncharacterized protein PAC_12587 [Phialocephala subalpina]|uniref:Uncharacterized protein n=1 Tax=Phialocephala subalpina TaxID=576137 RepID=A0A1L7XCB9_9HELO|nr:uncharacterized protein PAC_12587 [Phialocephala subalpina]